MKYVKTFESINDEYKIGDYVSLYHPSLDDDNYKHLLINTELIGMINDIQSTDDISYYEIIFMDGSNNWNNNIFGDWDISDHNIKYKLKKPKIEIFKALKIGNRYKL